MPKPLTWEPVRRELSRHPQRRSASGRAGRPDRPTRLETAPPRPQAVVHGRARAGSRTRVVGRAGRSTFCAGPPRRLRQQRATRGRTTGSAPAPSVGGPRIGRPNPHRAARRPARRASRRPVRTWNGRPAARPGIRRPSSRSRSPAGTLGGGHGEQSSAQPTAGLANGLEDVVDERPDKSPGVSGWKHRLRDTLRS